jgi:hypothetical protein
MQAQSITRRRLLAASGGTAVAGTFVGAAEASAKKGGGKKLTVEVAVTAFDSVRPPVPPAPNPTGPYFAAGDIYPKGGLKPDGTPKAGAKKLGTYRCHGWMYDAQSGANLSSQTLIFKDRGTITLIGGEPGPAAIAGGTQSYRNSRGQGTVTETEHEGGPPSLSIALEVIG